MLVLMKTIALTFSLLLLVSTSAWPRGEELGHEPNDRRFGSESVNFLHSFAADTVFAGRVYITTLPDSIDGQDVLRYSAQKLPLFSWLKGSGFFWKTRPSDVGRHVISFRAEVNSNTVIPVEIRVVVR
jgi:hypothetical protein